MAEETVDVRRAVAAAETAGPAASRPRRASNSPPTAGPSGTGIGHCANLDRLRVIAILTVVAFHLKPNEYLVWGLATFLILSCALSVRRAQPKPTADFVRARWSRIMAPWLFWSAVYGAYRVAVAVANAEPLSELFTFRMLLYGPAIHLWFLPFIFVAGLVAHGLHRATRAWPVKSCAAAAMLVGLSAAALTTIWTIDQGPPFDQWWLSVSAIPIGFALGRAMGAFPRQWQRRMWTAAMSIAWPATVLLYCVLPPDSPINCYTAALALVATALRFDWPMDSLTTALLPLVYGLYLVHPLVLHRIHGWPELAHYPLVGLGSALLLSCIIVALIRLTPLRRFV